MTCCHCEAAESQFSARTAEKDLQRYHRKGPDRTTRMLLAAVTDAGFDSATLLDIGGGVGVLHHELLADGVTTATNVDASSAYLEAAERESERRGQTGRVRFVHGDFVELADEVPAADIVTLDRVICCYPDPEHLIAASAGKARRLYVASYPRDRWFVKLLFFIENALFRLKRSDFRIFAHPASQIGELITAAGLTPCFRRDTPFWRIEAFSPENREA